MTESESDEDDGNDDFSLIDEETQSLELDSIIQSRNQVAAFDSSAPSTTTSDDNMDEAR